MLCSEFQIVKSDQGYEDYKPLPCNRWSCEYCQPRRKAALVRLAASGHPNKLLTITVNVHVGNSPVHRRALLHDAWKRLVKRILRQFALPPTQRWTLTGNPRTEKMQARVERAAARTPQRAVEQLHYMAFLERT
jgi:hypothetical protein